MDCHNGTEERSFIQIAFEYHLAYSMEWNTSIKQAYRISSGNVTLNVQLLSYTFTIFEMAHHKAMTFFYNIYS
jgi:hypothetical protein